MPFNEYLADCLTKENLWDATLPPILLSPPTSDLRNSLHTHLAHTHLSLDCTHNAMGHLKGHILPLGQWCHFMVHLFALFLPSLSLVM